MSLVANVFKAVMIDELTNDVIGTTTLQDGNIEVSVQEQDVRGGGSLIGILHSDRDINVAVTEATFKYDWLAKQLGQDIVTGAGVAYAMPKWYKVVDNAGTFTITLENDPSATDNALAIYKADGTKIVNPTVAAGVVTLTDVTAGEEVEVRTYKYDTAATTETLEIDNSVFAKGVKLVLETIEIDEETETVLNKIQWQFDKSLPTGNFTINTQQDKSAYAQGFNLRVIKPRTSDVVGRVLRIPVA